MSDLVKWAKPEDLHVHSPDCRASGCVKTVTAEEYNRLYALIHNPHTTDFLEAVRTEAAFQREHWKAEHDAGKDDADWFWLVGYLAGKALHKPEKQLHHIITTAAACLNWHMARTVGTDMRPGTAEPSLPPPVGDKHE